MATSKGLKRGAMLDSSLPQNRMEMRFFFCSGISTWLRMVQSSTSRPLRGSFSRIDWDSQQWTRGMSTKVDGSSSISPERAVESLMCGDGNSSDTTCGKIVGALIPRRALGVIPKTLCNFAKYSASGYESLNQRCTVLSLALIALASDRLNPLPHLMPNLSSAILMRRCSNCLWESVFLSINYATMFLY